MAIDLAEKAKELGLKYFLITYIDLFGVQRAKLVPASAIKGMQKNGAGFAGFATGSTSPPPTLTCSPSPTPRP
jgi:glutamine synthetase